MEISRLEVKQEIEEAQRFSPSTLTKKADEINDQRWQWPDKIRNKHVLYYTRFRAYV